MTPLMIGAYGWAFIKPIRKLYYNLTITVVSVLVALLIGGIEAVGLRSNRLNLRGGVWDLVRNLNDSLGTLGSAIMLTWVSSK